MIVSDVRKHPAILADATTTYAEATRLSVCFLIVENERMAKELQVAKQGGDLVKMLTRAELKKAILDEVLSLAHLCEHCTPNSVPCIKQLFIFTTRNINV